ncbi:MAG: glycine hydroxymethyltransferase [Chthonomonadales bacterium]|nr:glycine hydroxymethyltransferase [Chthonomonadales bacterium]
MSASAVGDSVLGTYLSGLGGRAADTGAAAVYAVLDHLRGAAPTVARAVVAELRDQRRNLKLIASENYSSLSVQLAHANLLTDKYAEGYPGHRFYAGCDNVDVVEAEAARLACELFGAEHAYVQPHSGADANLVAFLAILSARVQKPELDRLGQSDVSKLGDGDWAALRRMMHEQRLLALDYYSGGHLTHGYRHNVSAQLFDTHTYGVSPATGRIDLDRLREQAREVRPLILLAGYSAYPRRINFAGMREIADEVGAVFMVDMAHFAGLVAGKVFAGDYDPVAHAHIVTSTTHKTLRGPRGGIVLCKAEFAEWVDRGCPLILGGPLGHVIAAKAVALREASQPSFREYAARIVENAGALAEACMAEGMTVLTGGTDNHLLLVDVDATYGITGRQAESALRECGITLNRNSLPGDRNGPWYTSGLRVGTPAVTTLGMGPGEMRQVGRAMREVLAGVRPTGTSKARYSLDTDAAAAGRRRVEELLGEFPVYPQLDLDLLMGSVGIAEAEGG